MILWWALASIIYQRRWACYISSIVCALIDPCTRSESTFLIRMLCCAYLNTPRVKQPHVSQKPIWVGATLKITGKSGSTQITIFSETWRISNVVQGRPFVKTSVIFFDIFHHIDNSLTEGVIPGARWLPFYISSGPRLDSLKLDAQIYSRAHVFPIQPTDVMCTLPIHPPPFSLKRHKPL